MKIDGSEKGLKIMDYYFNHPYDEYQALEDEILQDIETAMEAGEDHCTCKMKCRWHGKCLECLMLHRAHQDHLPTCLWTMVNKRVEDPNGLTDHKNRTSSAGDGSGCAAVDETDGEALDETGVEAAGE